MKLLHHHSLKNLHSFGIDCFAENFCEIHSMEDLNELAKEIHTLPHPYLFLGGGSNILFRADFSGTIIKISLLGKQILQENEKEVFIYCAAGENWHSIVEWSVQNGWGGIENLALIPGNCGAVPIQNIGAYGVEICQHLQNVHWFELSSQTEKIITNEQCDFGYRDSIFKRDLKGKGIIMGITLRLSKTHTPHYNYADVQKELETRKIVQPTINDIFDAVVQIRLRKLPNPKEIGNAGSFFKNPIISSIQFSQLQSQYPEIPHYPQSDGQVKIPAGWLIEKAGWKGFRNGDAGVSPKQALVLINYGNAVGEDIFRLSQNILDDIHNKFNIQLEREVNIMA